MRSITLVFKNLSRRKGRTVFSSVGLILAISVITSTFTVSRSMQLSIGEEIEKYGPNIVVMPKTQSINVPYGSVFVGNTAFPEDSIEKIYTIPNNKNLRVLSPKVFGQLAHGNSTLLVTGIDPDREVTLKGWWNISGALPQRDTTEAIAGSTVGTALGLAIGSTLQVKDTVLTVVGLLGETGSVDDYSIFLTLHSAQTLLNLVGKVSLIDVGALCNDCPVEEIARQIVDVAPDVKATPVKQMVEAKMRTIEQAANFSFLLASIILAVGCAGVMNTMAASVHERTREIGIFMALGADNAHLYKMFLYESVVLGLIGGLTGILVGLTSSMLIGPLFTGIAVNLADTPLHMIPLTIILSVLTCIVASLYPIRKTSRIDPVSALRTL